MSLLKDILKDCTEVEQLAEGGQKKVFKGLHSEYGPVVIKIGDYRYSTSLDRIVREVEVLKDINSEFYPRNYEFFIDPLSHEFIIIEEYLDAEELTKVKNRFSTDEKILGLLKELICGLNILWQRRIVHRDLKPANILITSDDKPRIIDLGIARFLDRTSLTATLAASGPGTPVYAAPEQINNKKNMINERTDFFLLGLLSLELLLGFHPYDPKFVHNQNNIVENILAGIYFHPEELVDSKLIGFIQKSLEVLPYKRFRTSKDVMNYLTMEC